MIKYLVAILLTASAAYSQTIKTLGYNTTNGQVAYSGSNTLTFTNPLGFSNAAATRTNLGLGAGNDVRFKSVILQDAGGISNNITYGGEGLEFSTSGQLFLTTEAGYGVTFYKPIYFSASSNAATSRTNLGLGSSWLTNTNVTNFRSSIGLGLPALTNTNVTNFRTDIGLGSLATNNSVPSGAATTNSLLAADGAGGSAFVSTLPRLTLASGTITNTNPALSISQTWSNSAIAFTGLNFDIANSNSAVGSKAINITVNGSNNFLGIYRDNAGSGFAAIPRFEVGSGGVTWNIRTRTGGGVGCNFSDIVGLGSTLQFGVGSGTTAGDVILSRDAANTLALQNGTNAQTYNIYNTFSNSTNYERGKIAWTNNVMTIGTEKGTGGGTARALELQTDGTTRATISTAGAVTLSAGLSVVSSITFQGNSSIVGNISSGVIRLLDSGGTGFNRIQFGGSTTGFPALKRNTNFFQARLADDSDYTVMDAQLRSQGTAPTNSTAAGTAGDIRYDSNYFYVCISNATWRRTSLTNW